MLRNLVTAAAIALLFSAGTASAQKLDANGRCHDAKGQFAKAEVCAGLKAKPAAAANAAKPAGAASALASGSAASATAKSKPQKCKNDKGKFAKCGTPGAHPV